MDGRYDWTIQEIIADPRYRQFAAFCTEHGKQLIPDGFPWKLMGMTDRDIAESDLRYEGGDVLGTEWRAWVDDMIRVVRANEKLVVDWWHWWPGLEAVHKRHAPQEPAKVTQPAATVAAPKGFLFEL